MTATSRLAVGILTIGARTGVSLAGAQAQQRFGHFRPDFAERHVQGFIGLLDADGDGNVSAEEIAAEQSRLFSAIDFDGNGLISAEEFRRRANLLLSLNTTTLFDMMDADGDQNLALDEINQPSARWVKRYDTNGDGLLDAEEIRTARVGR